MKRAHWFIATVALCLAVVVGCSAPAASPTAAPAAKQTEPTKAPAAPTTVAAQPTKPAAAPAASKSAFPEKGRAITLLIPWEAGGITDIAGRVLAAGLEKEFGTPVQVVNRPGAASQVGITELARARPDGYTVGYTNLPGTLSTYLDKDRQAIYDRRSFEAVAVHAWSPGTIAVRPESPYKTLKDLIDDAKARPGQIKVSTVGLLSNTHLDLLLFEQAAGVKFAPVHFSGGAAQANPALLGGHVDASSQSAANYAGMFKNNQVRILGIMDNKPSEVLPGVPTMQSQGINVFSGNTITVAAPAGTPRDVIDVYANAIQKMLNDPEVQQRHRDLAFDPRFIGPAEVAKTWEETETKVAPLIEQAKKG